MSNGRVDILDKENSENSIFDLYDRIPVNNKASAYTDALRGDFEDSNLSLAYFSGQNVQANQNSIRAEVYRKTGKVICEQSEDVLKVIMRGIYLQNSANLPYDVTEQIRQLNKLVVDYAVPKIIGELDGYLKYCQDASEMYMPLSRPLAYSTKGDKVAKLKNFF